MRFLLIIFMLAFSAFSYGIKINKITIKGHKIIEENLIRSHLSLKVNRHFSHSKAQKDVRHLFSLGFFDSIEVHTYKNKKKLHVIYKIKERPLISEIEFQGNDNIKDEDLQSLSLIKNFDFIHFDKIYKTLSAIKEKYKEKGYFLTEASYKIVPLKKDKKIKLVIDVKENEKILIKKISIIGNRNVSDSFLKSAMVTKEQNLFSFLGSSGVYNPENLDKDLQLIEFLYRNKGYLNVRLEKPEISISPDQKGIYITLIVEEGMRLQIGQVGFKEDDIVSEAEVLDYLNLKQDDYFSLEALQADLSFVKNKYRERGYAFAEARPQIYPDPTGDKKVHILLTVDKGNAYKVNKIFIQGNSKTRDKVILRRLLLKEGDTYQESKKQMTQQLLQKLGFFENVQVDSVQGKGQEDLDLFIRLKERESTGEAHLAGGYNSYTRLFIKGGIKKNNFLGLDQSISFQASFNRYQELFSFSYVNPYFLDTDWSLGVDVFNFGQDMLNNQQSSFLSSSTNQFYSYSQLNTGFSLSFGHHLSDFLSVYLKYKLQDQSLSDESLQFFRKIPVIGPAFRFIFGDPVEKNTNIQSHSFMFSDIYPLEEGEGVNSSLSAILEYDKRNDRFYASQGHYSRISLEYSGLGGDFDYAKVESNFRYYKSLFWGIVFKNNFNFGWAFPTVKDKKVPFTEFFLLGGPYSLRGYRTNTVGPRHFSQQAFDYATENKFENPQQFAQRPYGGTKMWYYNLELEFPLVRRAQLKGAFFVDIGEVDNDLTLNFDSHLRLNAGVGIRWKSPFGPMNLDLGLPYKPRKKFGENEIELQFSAGSAF